MHKFNTIEIILTISLITALICSIIICVQVYIYKNTHYVKMFSTWQMPMIFAILADLYFMK